MIYIGTVLAHLGTFLKLFMLILSILLNSIEIDLFMLICLWETLIILFIHL